MNFSPISDDIFNPLIIYCPDNLIIFRQMH